MHAPTHARARAHEEDILADGEGLRVLPDGHFIRVRLMQADAAKRRAYQERQRQFEQAQKPKP